MSNAFTSTELLASLKRRGVIPSSASTFSASDFFKVVDEEIQTYIVPLLMEVREEYLVYSEDIDVTTGTNEYYIPERAIAGKLRDVTFDDGSGTFKSLSRIEPEQANASLVGTSCYYLQGNQIVFPGTVGTGTMRVSYYRRPNRIVATDAVGQVDAIDTDLARITFTATPPSTFVTDPTDPPLYDFIKGKPGFDTIAQDLYPLNISGGYGYFSLELAGTEYLPSDLAVGDYVCLAQESPIPQIPVELHPLLAERVTATILHALGDAKADTAYRVANEMEARLLKVLSPRTEGSSRYVSNKYGVGRNRGFGYRRGW